MDIIAAKKNVYKNKIDKLLTLSPISDTTMEVNDYPKETVCFDSNSFAVDK